MRTIWFRDIILSEKKKEASFPIRIYYLLPPWASTLFRFSRVHQYQFGCSILDSDDLMR